MADPISPESYSVVGLELFETLRPFRIQSPLLLFKCTAIACANTRCCRIVLIFLFILYLEMLKVSLTAHPAAFCLSNNSSSTFDSPYFSSGHSLDKSENVLLKPNQRVEFALFTNQSRSPPSIGCRLDPRYCHQSEDECKPSNPSRTYPLTSFATRTISERI